MSIILKDRKEIISDVVISTALGQGGRGMFPYNLLSEYWVLLNLIKDRNITIFTKSSTRYPRVGNFRIMRPWTWKYIQKMPHRSILNAYGLTNNGVKINATEIAVSCAKGFNIIPNYYPEFEKGISVVLVELDEAISIYKEHIGNNFWAIELNASCPNSREVINENMDMVIKCVAMLKRRHPWLVIIIKTSIVHPYYFYKRLEDAGTDIIHAINSAPYSLVFNNTRSPFYKKGGGGVSGKSAYRVAFDYNKEVRKSTQLPIIMGCGITSVDSKNEFFRIGANAVSICTIIFYSPKEAGYIIAPVSGSSIL